MQVPIFRAKDMDSNDIVEGFYFNYPEIENTANDTVLVEDVVPSVVKHCLLTYKPAPMSGMMAGLTGSMSGPVINEPFGCNIDIKTLEFVRFEDIPCKD